MANYPTYNPKSDEAKSALIAGLTRAVKTLSQSLNLQTSEIEDFEMTELFISDEDRNRIYEVELDKKGWLSDPAPVFKKNGVVIEPLSEFFTIDYLGGSIEFIGETYTRPTTSDTITVTATYINQYSTVLENLSTALDAVKTKTDKYIGSFNSLTDLQTVYDTPSVGDYAIILGSEYTIYIWDNTNSQWQKAYKDVDLTDFYEKSEVDTLLNSKEPTVTAHGTTSSSDDYYYSGRKSWLDLLAKIRGTVLTGLSTATQTAITATDTILTALGKLQGQVSQNATDIGLRATIVALTQVSDVAMPKTGGTFTGGITVQGNITQSGSELGIGSGSISTWNGNMNLRGVEIVAQNQEGNAYAPIIASDFKNSNGVNMMTNKSGATLLWSNSDSTFAEQTVSLGTSAYNFRVLVIKFAGLAASIEITCNSTVGSRYFSVNSTATSSTVVTTRRGVVLNDSIIFYDCTTSGTGATNNVYLRPTEIYGIY